MCGIAGIFSFDKNINEDHIRAMTRCIEHRGPDSKGYYIDQNISLGHQRLSIIDLSEKGNQPMISKNGRYIMVYNGEVYNYREIAAELKQSFSIQFNSNSDSEVILEAFVYYGKDFVKKLNGMFAIAIYDKQEKELHLFRDRIGIKPLFYYWDGYNFVFASELKSIVSLPFIPKIINKRAIQNFLHLGFVPNPESIYQKIKKQDAGTYLKVLQQSLEISTFWDTKSIIHSQPIKNEKQALVKLSDLLMSSVQYQLKSDVPFGVFLSGGVDSSLITALAVNLAGTTINTFSIGFKENKYNESEHAQKVAKYLKTNHHEFIVSHNDAIDLVDKMIQTYDEPFADSSAIPTMLVSKLAKKHVTVALSGEGGDELFMGYGSYKWANWLSNPVIRSVRNNLSTLLSTLGEKYNKASNHLKYIDEDDIPNNIHSQEHNYFLQSELKELLTQDYSNLRFEIKKNIFDDLNRKLNGSEKQVLFDLNYYLQDDLLTKVDRASMQYSLETRVPYLDHRVIEFALNLAPNLKNKNGVQKYILKEILYQYLPKEYFNRPKQGFAIPLQQWLKKELKYLITNYLNDDIIKRYDVVNLNHTQKLIKEFEAGNNYLYNRIWQLIILHKWMENNNVQLT